MNKHIKSSLLYLVMFSIFYVLISGPKNVLTNVIVGYAKLTNESSPPDMVQIPAGTDFIVKPDDYIEMTQKTALWASTMTFALNNRSHITRAYDEAFIYAFFNDLISDNFIDWTVHSPFGLKVWTGKDEFMNKMDGYIPYNKSFANNANHTITAPVIFYTGENTATMFVSALNRTVERGISDNRVPIWSLNIYWEKLGNKWHIVKGTSFYQAA